MDGSEKDELGKMKKEDGNSDEPGGEEEEKRKTNMNKKQRVVLIMGAIILLIVVFTAPKVNMSEGIYTKPSKSKPAKLSEVTDIRTAIVRAMGVIGATIFIFFALKDNLRGQTPKRVDDASNTDGICLENGGQVGHVEIKKMIKGTYDKVFNFLREFF